jgi:RNA polymerase sigma factor (sigma-70 family)
MATNQLSGVISTLRRATLPRDGSEPTDGQLLECYLSSREESAFAALVHRHGPMVWGVCRRVLGTDDAEDAFQATFLVLVRKAASIRQREAVSSWLYGVAHQTALKARAVTTRRRTREKQVSAMPEPVVPSQVLSDDLQTLLDQELSRLPEKYRAVLILCDLEGKTRKEAARHVRVPEGTVASRLATARSMLARRLARHGLTVSSGTLAAVLSPKVASASLPAGVLSSTIKAASHLAAGQATAAGAISLKAVALAEGVLKTMLLNKLKIATAVLVLLAVVGIGAVALTQRVRADKSAGPPVAEKSALAEKPAVQPVKADKESAIQPVKVQAEKNMQGQSPQLAACEWARIETVDVEKRTITFDDKAPAAVAGKTFSVPQDAQIEIDRKPGKLADLPPGAFLCGITLSEDRQSVLRFNAEGPQLGCLPARVETVDVGKGTLTFDDKAPALVADKTFSVPPSANITIDGKPGKLADLPPGAFLTLGLSADRKSVLHFNAQGPNVQDCSGSVVKAVDVERNTITFDDTARAEVAGKTFIVAPDANITIDGKPGKLSGLPAGSHVNVTFAVDRQTVRHLSAQGPTISDCPGSLVKAVDVERSTISFDDKARAELAGKTFRVAADAGITIDGKRGKLSELPAGAFVNLTFAVDRETIRHLNAQGPQVSDCTGSVVTAVDVERSTITFDGKARAELAGKTFSVADNANITIDGKPGKLSGLPAGAFVNLAFAVDRKTVQHLSAQGPQVSDCSGSMVKAVDIERSTIAFDDKARAELAGKTFSVADNANITIDGKPAKLSGLPAGAFVNLTFAVDRKTVQHLSAQGAQLLCDCGGSTVKAVDAEKGTITFADKVRAEVAGKTFSVAKDAGIVINGKPGKLSELPAGAAVSASLCVDQKTIGRIDAKVP